MKRGKYSSSFDNAYKSEKVFRTYFLKNSDVVRFKRLTWKKFSDFNFISDCGFPKTKIFSLFKEKGTDKDERFVRVIKNFEKEFIKKEKRKQKCFSPFNFKLKITASIVKYYFFKLSKKLKRDMNEQGLLFHSQYSKKFYGFENPAFYRKNKLIGKVINQEPMILINLSKNERIKLGKKVKFDKLLLGHSD